MSKRINGLVFPGDMNGIVALTQRIRRDFVPLAMKRRATFLAAEITHRMDTERFVLIPPVQGPANYMSNAYQDMQARIRKMEAGEADPEIDISCEICVIPFGGRVYGILYGDWREDILAIPGVQDWHFQDSTDRPASITASEWADRREVWDQIFALTLVPSDVGLIAKIVSNDARMGPTSQMIEDNQPDIGKRAARLAREAAIKEHFTRLPQGLHTPSELMKWLDTPYAAQRITSLTAEFALRMAPLTQAQMLGKERQPE